MTAKPAHVIVTALKKRRQRPAQTSALKRKSPQALSITKTAQRLGQQGQPPCDAAIRAMPATLTAIMTELGASKALDQIMLAGECLGRF